MYICSTEANKVNHTHLDEAVVEVEADEAGEDAAVRLVGVDEHLLHDVVGVRARVGVVVLAQRLRRRAVEAQRRHNNNQHGYDGGGRTRRSGRGNHHL
jgi:hypothetical protein